MQNYAKRCVIAGAIILAAAVFVNAIWAGRAPQVVYKVNFKSVPMQIGDLKGSRVPVEQRIFQYLGADAMDEILYEGPSGRAVHLSLIYSSDWRGVHSPLSCYPQQGWLVDEQREIEVPAPPGCAHPGPLKARLMRVHKDASRLVALYVFAHDGGTASTYEAQSLAVLRAPRGSGGLVLALSSPVGREGYRDALATAETVLRGAYVPAVAFWYANSQSKRQL